MKQSFAQAFMYSPNSGSASIKEEYTITVYTENHIGLLTRISIIFSRRKINIESLNTSPSEIPGIHRFNIVIQNLWLLHTNQSERLFISFEICNQ